ncbi:MAG: chorismate synthase, partial [Lentisphaeria bacterium]|nr:chorismate synthase [Lentisphaeria bacterium]
PCIVPRIIPVVEAMAALVLADCVLRQKALR